MPVNLTLAPHGDVLKQALRCPCGGCEDVRDLIRRTVAAFDFCAVTTGMGDEYLSYIEAKMRASAGSADMQKALGDADAKE